MKKVINLIKNNFLCIYIILNILFVFTSSYLFTVGTFKYSFYGDMLHKAVILNIIVSIIILIKKIKEKTYKINIIDILLLLILMFTIISARLAYDTKIAINGEKGRYEGLYAIIYYMSLLFMSGFLKKNQKKYVIGIIIFGGAVQAIYSLFQMFEINIVKIFYHHGELWVTGFTINPNFYGQLILMCLLYTIGLYFKARKGLMINGVYLLLITLFIVALLGSNTLSCALSLIVILILLLIYSIKNKCYKKLIIILVILFLTTFVITKIGKTRLVHDIIKTVNESAEISKGNLDDNYGTKRMAVYKRTVKVIPRYLLHGVGVDNFGKILDGKPIIYGRFFYDKAHSEPLQILVTEGIFALITYMSLFIIVLYKGIKECVKDKELYFILPVVGYLIQALFSISVIEVAPIFYIALGLLINREN